MRHKQYVAAGLSLTVLLLIGNCFQPARAQDDESKSIKAGEFIKERPTKDSKRPVNQAKYRRPANVSPQATPPAGMVFAQVGVTIWRFRPSTTLDKTKELIEEDGQEKEVTLERIEEGTRVLPGQKIRLSVESLSREGFLYIVDRERYSDGTYGDPLLIFPTKRTANSNRVSAGRLVYIPSPKGKFVITPSVTSRTQVAEVITVLVSPEQLVPADGLDTKSIRLSRQLFESWEKKWEASLTKFELEGGAGQTMTDMEQAAALDDSQVFTQNDPFPQTVYRVAIKPQAAVLVSVPLQFERPKP